MNDLQLGAFDVETNKYVSPYEAVKGNSYKCIECEKKVIFRKGSIRRPHFAHAVQTNVCSYYEHPNETQIHKDAKMLLAKLLSEKRQMCFNWMCDNCKEPAFAFEDIACNAKHIPKIKYEENDNVKTEYRNPNDSWVADVAIVNNGNVRYIFEIKHTHKTQTKRPEPWFEVNATDFIKTVSENHDNELMEFYCCRTDLKRLCYGSFCCEEFWTDNIPIIDKNCNAQNCVLCNKSDYEAVYNRKFHIDMKICYDCLYEDIFKSRLRTLYVPPRSCYGKCLIQTARGYRKEFNCPENCEPKQCQKCNLLIPECIKYANNGHCLNCAAQLYYNSNCVTFLNVPFARKDEAKTHGAKWNAERKKWYIPNDSLRKEKLIDLFGVAK